MALLRSEAGRNLHDRELSDLVGELATQSHEFRSLWAAHKVRLHTKGVKQLHHPVVGELELSFNRLEVLADGLTIVVYSAEPGSKSAEALGLLASWAATPDAVDVQRLRDKRATADLRIQTQKAPADWVTGDIYIDAAAAPEATSTFAAALVHFTPGARTAWHTHPHGQTIFVTEAWGCAHARAARSRRSGRATACSSSRARTTGTARRLHGPLAMQQNDETGSPLTWGEQVTDERYGQTPTS